MRPYTVCLMSLGTSADWGLSSDIDSDQGDDEIVFNHEKQDFAPPSRPSHKRLISGELKSLVMANESISRTTKFYNLFAVVTYQNTSILTL